MKRPLPALLITVASVMAFVGCATSGKPGTGAAGPAEPIPHMGIVYATPDNVELRLDLVVPGEGKGPFPAIVFIFGGGFQGGARSHWGTEIVLAAKRGYVGVSIDHRLVTMQPDGKAKYPFPAQVHDVKCAIRWLRANAQKYGIDRDRIGVIGFSSGGHLALMLGLTEPSDGLEGDCGDLSVSSRVQAAVCLAGGGDTISAFNITLTLHNSEGQEAFLSGTR